MKIHIAVTILWVLLSAVLGSQADWSGIEPNEVGDFLAGTAAPPAFYWLIVGFFMQRAELMLQRTELELARRQFARQATALEETTSLHRQTLELSERELAQSELREIVATIPERMSAIIEFLSSTAILKSPKHDKTITFQKRGITNTTDTEELITQFEAAVSAWPENVHGLLRECFSVTRPGAFYNAEQDIYHLANWFRITNQKAIEVGADFFYQECKRAKLINLLSALNEMMNPMEDWGLYIGSDR